MFNKLKNKILFIFNVLFGNYSSKGVPLKCRKCGSKEFDYKVIESIQGVTLEEHCFCKNCGTFLAIWDCGKFFAIFNSDKKSKKDYSIRDLDDWYIIPLGYYDFSISPITNKSVMIGVNKFTDPEVPVPTDIGYIEHIEDREHIKKVISERVNSTKKQLYNFDKAQALKCVLETEENLDTIVDLIYNKLKEWRSKNNG